MIAALFVQKNGCYFGLPNVDPWDEARDARKYKGPWPVVAHPPCSRWCRIAGVVEKRWGHKRGEDGGCFKSALDSVRKFGGVLEHPAFSKAFYKYGLPIPIPGGGWQMGICGGWSCYVEQGNYGHRAKKATWLYYFGETIPPSLNWRLIPNGESEALVSFCGNKVKINKGRPRLTPVEASATTEDFKFELITMAEKSRHV